MNKTCIIIAGPTAVGKTALSIELASHFNAEIISADSRQCFRELNIGVAKPTPDELSKVRHHFINSHSIHEEVNASVFEEYALHTVNKLFEKNEVVVMTGGTGLYIKAFREGMDAIPPIPEDVRKFVIKKYQDLGIDWLVSQLEEKDPLFAAKGEMKNPQRMMRALEVVLQTGQSIFSFRKNQQHQREFRIIPIALELPREQLYERINKRVDMMFEDGLLDEARSLLPFRHLNALQTVGYTELFDYFDGKTNSDRAVELIKQNTRHYAKRQMTWFKRDAETKWFLPDINLLREWFKGLMA